ncbi:monovalent cation/H(+) antiporter subunit G [Methanolapillus ohkumae]|uniref:Monovalent cation/H(+) antiporter subunit G n=1 Tax=Methanolapillus ohkumae TaxID=3028298 RepID=A0AA97A6Y3_9EURY|nr:hypothetical protein MsAm2_15500 [Methanosarcinaceae archaeon Am2]
MDIDFSTIRLWACYFFLLLGVLDILIGMIGLIRLPDIYNRLHATTKIATTGAFFVLLGILIADGFTPLGIKSIAIAIFLLMTAPVAGHVIARAAYNINVPPCDQTVFDAYCGKRQGDYCDDFDYHEGAYVYVDLDKRDHDHSFNKYKENLTSQFAKELTDLTSDMVETTPDLSAAQKEADLESKSAPEFKPESESKFEPKPESKPESKLEFKSESKLESEPGMDDLDGVISEPENVSSKTELEQKPELAEGFSKEELKDKLEENPELSTSIPEKKLKSMRENDEQDKKE